MVNLESLKSVRAQKAHPQVITSFQSSGGIGLSIDFFIKTGKFQLTQNVFVSRMKKCWKIIKRAGSNKAEQGGKKGGKIVKRACLFIRYLRVVT